MTFACQIWTKSAEIVSDKKVDIKYSKQALIYFTAGIHHDTGHKSEDKASDKNMYQDEAKEPEESEVLLKCHQSIL